jgi:ATP-dependent Clp protease ATP-binding subunit ClpC
MPKINVYLPQWLADAVRNADVAVSEVCQHALAAALGRNSPVAMSEATSVIEWVRQSVDERAQDLERAAAAVRYGLAPTKSVPAMIKPIGAATALSMLKAADPTVVEWELKAQDVAGYAAALEVVRELNASNAVVELFEARLAEAHAALASVQISDRFGSHADVLDLVAELTERSHPRPPR